MKSPRSETLVSAHELNSLCQSKVANRIALYAPLTVYNALTKLESKLKNYSASKSSILRTVVPGWGGPSTIRGKLCNINVVLTQFLIGLLFSE